MLSKPGQSIDLGAIAKGYAADLVRHILLANGINDFLINLGGTVIIGDKICNVGIQNPFMPTGTPMGRMGIINNALVTSRFKRKVFYQRRNAVSSYS